MANTKGNVQGLGYLRIASINVNGLKTRGKLEELYEKVKSENIDVLLLQETHLISAQEIEIANEMKKKGAYKSFFGEGTNRSAGVAVILWSKIDYRPESVYIGQNGRIITIDIKTPDRKTIHLVNIYAPTNCDARTKHQFFEEIDIHVHSNHPTIMAGDFNCIQNPELDRSPYNSKHNYDYQLNTSLDFLMETHELIDIFRYKNPNIKQYTYRNVNQNGQLIQTRLDRYLCSKSFEQADFKFEDFPSDYDMVIMNVKQTTRKIKYGKGYYKTNIKIFDDQFLEEFEEEWNQYRTLMPFCKDKLEWWLAVKKHIKRLFIQKSLQKTQANNKQTKALIQKLHCLIDNMKDGKNQHFISRYKQVKKQIRENFIQKHDKEFIKKQADKYDYNEKCNKYFFRNLKKKDNINKRITIPRQNI